MLKALARWILRKPLPTVADCRLKSRQCFGALTLVKIEEETTFFCALHLSEYYKPKLYL